MPPLANSLGANAEFSRRNPLDEIPLGIHEQPYRTIRPVMQAPDNRASEKNGQPVHYRPMPKLPASVFKREFCARVKRLRINAGYSQKTMAAALQITENTYSTYERRSLLPPRLTHPFALFVGATAEHVITGLGKAPPPREGPPDGGPKRKQSGARSKLVRLESKEGGGQ